MKTGGDSGLGVPAEQCMLRSSGSRARRKSKADLPLSSKVVSSPEIWAL